MKTEHTPGPWTMDHDAERNTVYLESKGKVFMMLDDDNMANVRLIAAAPELLEALESLRGIEAWITDPKMKKLFQKKVYPAINKAHGQQKSGES